MCQEFDHDDVTVLSPVLIINIQTSFIICHKFYHPPIFFIRYDAATTAF